MCHNDCFINFIAALLLAAMKLNHISIYVLWFCDSLDVTFGIKMTCII